MLCLEKDQDDVREAFMNRLRVEFGCARNRATVLSWLRLQRMGPESRDDIIRAALAADDIELAQAAGQLWKGLEERRARHRRLGAWLTKALSRSVGFDSALSEKVIDQDLELTFGDLQRGVSVSRIASVKRTAGAADA